MLHPLGIAWGREQANRCRVAGERAVGEGVYLGESLRAHGLCVGLELMGEGRTFVEVAQGSQHGSGDPLRRGDLAVEAAAQTIEDQTTPAGLEGNRRLEVFGFRHARPLRTRARDAGAYGATRQVVILPVSFRPMARKPLRGAWATQLQRR
jgi:hypothetical protein